MEKKDSAATEDNGRFFTVALERGRRAAYGSKPLCGMRGVHAEVANNMGEGNPRAPIAVILDNPGAREDKEGKEFVCGVRCTLQTALKCVNLGEKDVYITYILKCRPLRSYDRARAAAFSMPFLLRQIRTVSPRFLLCLGDTVARTVLSDEDASVKALRGKWHNIFDLPSRLSYHPLAVRRRPSLLNAFSDDLSALSERYKKGY